MDLRHHIYTGIMRVPAKNITPLPLLMIAYEPPGSVNNLAQLAHRDNVLSATHYELSMPSTLSVVTATGAKAHPRLVILPSQTSDWHLCVKMSVAHPPATLITFSPPSPRWMSSAAANDDTVLLFTTYDSELPPADTPSHHLYEWLRPRVSRNWFRHARVAIRTRQHRKEAA